MNMAFITRYPAASGGDVRHPHCGRLHPVAAALRTAPSHPLHPLGRPRREESLEVRLNGEGELVDKDLLKSGDVVLLVED